MHGVLIRPWWGQHRRDEFAAYAVICGHGDDEGQRPTHCMEPPDSQADYQCPGTRLGRGSGGIMSI